jgi:parvulin-like peptidyl-prolyl isomerase
MRIFISVVFIGFLFFSACAPDKEKVRLEPGTETYNLAKDLAVIVPSVDPDSNKVIISTDNFEITSGEVVDALHKNFGPKAADLKKMDAARIKQILDMNAVKLAEQNLLLEAADEKGIVVGQETLDSLLQTQFNHVGGEQVFMDFINKNGISIDVVKKDISDGYRVDLYLKSVLKEETAVDEEELKSRYRRLIQKDRTASVRHILLVTKNKSETEKKEIYQKMKTIEARAKKGEDFAQLAKTYSEDPGSKDKGGLYENFERGAMVKPFEDAAFSVPVGEISGIIETIHGYHILKVLDRKSESRSFDDLKDDLQKEVQREKERDVYMAHMEKLKEGVNYKKVDW